MEKILIVGDIMLDQYDTCEYLKDYNGVNVYRYLQTSYMLGGAANVAKCFYVLGFHPYLFGYIGNDDHGKQVKELLGYINSKFVYTTDIPTTIKRRIIVGKEIKCRVDSEKTDIINDYAAENAVLANLDNYCAIVISDYQKGVVNPRFIQQLIYQGNLLKIPIFVDTKSQILEHFCNCDYMVITLNEFNNTENSSFQSLSSVGNTGYVFLDKYRIKNLVIKRKCFIFKKSFSALICP